MSAQTIELSEKVMDAVRSVLEGKFVTIGVDGWTNCRHDKIHNVLALTPGKVCFSLLRNNFVHLVILCFSKCLAGILHCF